MGAGRGWLPILSAPLRLTVGDVVRGAVVRLPATDGCGAPTLAELTDGAFNEAEAPLDCIVE